MSEIINCDPVWKDFILNKISIFSGTALYRAAYDLPDKYWNMSTEKIIEQSKFTPLDEMLRYRMWHIIRVNEHTKTEIKQSFLYDGFCTYAHWHQNILNNPKKLAYLLLPTYKNKKISRR